MEQILVLRDNAQQQLMEIKTVEDGVTYLNKVKAIEVWAKAEKKDAELQNIVAEQKLRTQRKLGEMIKEGQEAGQIAKKGENQSNLVQDGNRVKKTLQEVGITRKESSTFKTIAEIPEEKFEEVITEKKEAVNKAVSELTTAGMLKVAKESSSRDNAEIKPIPIPEGVFDLIYADPPWRYDFSETKSRDIENQYPTMDIEEIKSIKVPSTENSVLLLWATSPKLIEALEVMKSWGFEYKTHAIWDKEKIGMGYWFRGQHELLMVGVKGKFSPPLPENRLSSLIREKRTIHSKKPEIVYEMIETMFPSAKKLELFARNERKDWFSWGNQVDLK